MRYTSIQYTVPDWRGLRYVKDESIGLDCDSTSSISQDILKSDNLLHKQGFVKTQSSYTVTTVNESEEASSNSLELPLCIIG